MRFTPETDPKDWNPGSGKAVMPPAGAKKHGTGHGMERPSAGTSPVKFSGSPPKDVKHSIDGLPGKMPRSHNR